MSHVFNGFTLAGDTTHSGSEQVSRRPSIGSFWQPGETAATAVGPAMEEGILGTQGTKCLFFLTSRQVPLLLPPPPAITAHGSLDRKQEIQIQTTTTTFHPTCP
jgi:hypothetical protein